MSNHANIALVRAYLAAAGTGDLDRAADFFSDQFVYVVPGNNPLAGIHRNKRAALDYFGKLMAASGGTYRIESEVDWLVSESRVLLIADESMTIDGHGHAWTRYVLFRIRAGRFAEVRLFEDDQSAFDAVWDRRTPAASVTSGAP